MASPFKIFRKYSSGIMIVMVVLSMLLFTLTDLFSDPSANLWLLGLLLGGFVFAVAGVGQGRWLQWGIGGAVLGALMGLILPEFVEGGGLSTSLGVVTEEDIQDMEIRRSIANQFMFQAMEESFGEGTGRFAPLFGFNHQSREDVIFGKMMRAEADRLGIVVDQEMVQAFLKARMNDKLTSSSFVKIRNNLQYKRKTLTDADVTDILGDEIKAQMAWQTLRPRTTTLPPGPEVYWEYFRRLNVRQQLNTVGIAVDDFLDEVEAPSEAEISQLFTQFSKKFPNQVEPGSPGFRLPFRARLAYVELDSESLASEVADVTDEDIQKYYDDNKETPLIRKPILPDAEEKTPDDKNSESSGGDSKESDSKESSDGDNKNDSADSDKKPADSGAEEANADADKAPVNPEKKDASVPERPTPDEAKPDKAKADKPKEADAKPQESSKSEATSQTPDPPEEASGDDGSCDPFEPGDEKADEAAAADETEESPKQKAADKPEEKTAQPAKPEAQEKPAGSEEADSKKTAAPSLIIPDKGTTESAPKIVPAAPDESATPKEKPPEIEYEYRVLDDELRKEIREEIKRQRTKEIAEKKMSSVIAEMQTLALERSRKRFALEDPAKFDSDNEKAMKELREALRPVDDSINDRLKKYAEENGLAYAETPMISYSDFLNEEDYPIASATEPNDNPMLAARSANVALTTFQGFNNDEQNNDAQLYLARRAQRTTLALESGQSHFAYWAIDFSIAHLPKLDEPGVREAVVDAAKRIKARELVQKRCEDLAEKVRTGLAKVGEEKQDMATVLKDETATGKPDGGAVAVRKTMPFSWLRTSSASPMNFQQQQATLSPIQFSDGTGGVLNLAGDQFMEKIFQDLKDEEVGVVANADLSRFYVVHVTNRFPTPEVGEEGLKERFATEGKQFGFAQSPILGVMQQQLSGPATVEWERSVWLRYGVNPDEDPDAG